MKNSGRCVLCLPTKSELPRPLEGGACTSGRGEMRFWDYRSCGLWATPVLLIWIDLKGGCGRLVLGILWVLGYSG